MLPGAASPPAKAINVNGPADGSISPSSVGSPVRERQRSGGGSIVGRKRKQDSLAGVQSPESVETWDTGDESRIGVKRACNECRQQKLRCDVVQDPFTPCSRCQRCRLGCRIDASFKRVGKRKKNQEMEQEIVELRKQLANQHSPSHHPPLLPFSGINHTLSVPQAPQTHSNMSQFMGSHDAVTAMIEMKTQRSPDPRPPHSRELYDVRLTHEQIQELFNIFFTYYHPFLPLMNPQRGPDFYFEECPLLFWTMIAVAARRYEKAPHMINSLSASVPKILWATVGDVPQGYLVVKALCTLCTWQLPVSSTSADPTLMISGLMMQIALQIGLHRPSHAQDFSKFRVDMREEELRDRIKTWAACNVVAQRVATGYGQPPNTLYDWTLGPPGEKEPSFKLREDLEAGVKIEMFCNKVTTELYSNVRDPVGLALEEAASDFLDILEGDLAELEASLMPLTEMNNLCLQAARLHLRLWAFFDSPTTKRYLRDLTKLWHATTGFLETAFNLRSDGAGNIIAFATNYILQMMLAAGFTLLKLLNSFFADGDKREYGKHIFKRTIETIRLISITGNDLPSRLAEVLVQLWMANGAGIKMEPERAIDNSLQLKVRCRMSMSLVFDSVWRWREEIQAKGRVPLETALKNPTNPETVPESSSQPIMDTSNGLAPPSLVISRTATPGGDYGFGEWNNEVFDPLNWMLDGLVDLPYGGYASHSLEHSIGA